MKEHGDHRRSEPGAFRSSVEGNTGRSADRCLVLGFTSRVREHQDDRMSSLVRSDLLGSVDLIRQLLDDDDFRIMAKPRPQRDVSRQTRFSASQLRLSLVRILRMTPYEAVPCSAHAAGSSSSSSSSSIVRRTQMSSDDALLTASVR